jgi:hypothetical protein
MDPTCNCEPIAAHGSELTVPQLMQTGLKHPFARPFLTRRQFLDFEDRLFVKASKTPFQAFMSIYVQSNHKLQWCF